MTRRYLGSCCRHPKKLQVLTQVGRGSLETVLEGGAPRCAGATYGKVDAADGEVGAADGEGGVARGALMQSGVAQRRASRLLTDLPVLTGPGSTRTNLSTFSSQSKRDRKKTNSKFQSLNFYNLSINTKSHAS